MDSMQEILDFLQKNYTWQNDEDFIVSQLFEMSFKNLLVCEQYLKSNYKTLIFPLLRQVKESSIIILGIDEKVMTADDFIQKKYSQKDIIKRIRESSKVSDNKNVEILNQYYNSLKDPLNDYAHVNFETLMMHFTERLKDALMDNYFEITINTFIYLLQYPLVGMFNHKYKSSFNLPTLSKIEENIKKMKNFRHILYKIDLKEIDFIKKSTNITNYFKSKKSTSLELIKELKKLEN